MRKVPPEAGSGQRRAESARRHERRMDQHAHGHQIAPRCRRGNRYRSGRSRCPPSAGSCRRRLARGRRGHRPRFHRPRHLRHHHARRAGALGRRAAAPPPGSRERHCVRPERRLHGLRVRPDRGRVHDGRFDRRSARCRGPQPRSPRARGGSRAPDARDGLERP